MPKTSEHTFQLCMPNMFRECQNRNGNRWLITSQHSLTHSVSQTVRSRIYLVWCQSANISSGPGSQWVADRLGVLSPASCSVVCLPWRVLDEDFLFQQYPSARTKVCWWSSIQWTAFQEQVLLLTRRKMNPRSWVWMLETTYKEANAKRGTGSRSLFLRGCQLIEKAGPKAVCRDNTRKEGERTQEIHPFEPNKSDGKRFLGEGEKDNFGEGTEWQKQETKGRCSKYVDVDNYHSNDKWRWLSRTGSGARNTPWNRISLDGGSNVKSWWGFCTCSCW